MKGKIKIAVTLISTCVLLVSCSNKVNGVTPDVEQLGSDNLEFIGNDLYYDSTTKVVYMTYFKEITAYYAPNGLPYIYDELTGHLEKIEN